jgi:phosphoglycolate phosphatase-like HAD superfamily hydrolase
MPGLVELTASRRAVLLGMGAFALAGAFPAFAQDDPLSAWNDTPTKEAILDFVKAAVADGGAGFVPPEQRIAVFDMDGTLIPEQPMPAAVFPFIAQLKMAAEANPALMEKPAIAAVLKGDLAGLRAAGEEGQAAVLAAITDGKTVEEAALEIKRLASAEKNTKFNRPLRGLAYEPMLDVLHLLEANGFQNWICSGSPVLFTRQLSQEMFGIPPERVMGTNVDTRFVEEGGRSELVFGQQIDHLNDKEGKPATINLAIGQRPAFIGGNVRSVGDIAMMRYSKDRDGPSFQMLINHDDAKREFAYAEPGDESLKAAAKYGFHIVSMANDWKRILLHGTDGA